RRAPTPSRCRCCGGSTRSTGTSSSSGSTSRCWSRCCRPRCSTTCCWPRAGRSLIWMPDRSSRDFPLFPLGIVALPGELVPLHIFEERYKTMMNECLRDEREFGIVWLSDDSLREIGCACAIERVIERMEDGRMNLLTRGTRPFRVVERQSELAYPAGVIEFLEDRDEPVDSELAEEARAAYAELLRRATDNEPEDDALADMGAYAMAAT